MHTVACEFDIQGSSFDFLKILRDKSAIANSHNTATDGENVIIVFWRHETKMILICRGGTQNIVTPFPKVLLLLH